MKSVNSIIKYVLCDSNYGNLGSTYENICPTFYTTSNVLHSINLSNYQEGAVYKQCDDVFDRDDVNMTSVVET